jgi:hypothetical protein
MNVLQKRFLLSAILLAFFGVAFFVPLPYPTSQVEKEEALHLALEALINGSTVNGPDGQRELSERRLFLGHTKRMYFRNDTGVPDRVFLNYGLKPVPPNTRLDLDGGDVVVNASYTGTDSEGTWHLQFSYVFGSEGGHGYEIRIYKNALSKSIVFVPTWIS